MSTKTHNVTTDRLQWLAVDGSIGAGFIRAWCADGDGFVAVFQYEQNSYAVEEQGDHIATFSTLNDAIAHAEQFIVENYPHLIVRAESMKTLLTMKTMFHT